MEEGAQAEKRLVSTPFWRVFAFINLITVLWVGWVIWQLTPHPVVYDFVLRLPVSGSGQRASGTIPAAPNAAAPAGTLPAPSAAPPELPIHSDPPMAPLRLDTEIKVPPKSNEPATPVDARRAGGGAH